MTMVRVQFAAPERALGVAKSWVSRELEFEHLPELPDLVEEVLNLQGKSAWTYKYSDVTIEEGPTSREMAFIVQALLKRELRACATVYRHRFRVRCSYLKETKKLRIVELVRIPAGG